MHQTDAATERCGGCDGAIREARHGWWLVSHTRQGERRAFCSSSCAAAFFEEEERREVAELSGARTRT